MSMATKRLLFASLLLFLFSFQVLAEAFSDAGTEQPAGKEGSQDALGTVVLPPKINCDFACARRCMRASRQNVCKRACGTCCARCQCVPSGTFGNKNTCPCYANLTTRGRKPKCP